MTPSQIKNLKICRTCFHPIRCGKYVQLQNVCSPTESESVEEMLTEVVPEIDMKAVVDPVICKTCLTMLQTSYKFRKACVANETNLVEQMQIAGMKSVKLNYITENNSIVKCEQDEADFQTDTNQPSCPLPIDTVNSVEDIKHYCKESGFDTSIEIIEIKSETDCLQEVVCGQSEIKMEDYRSSEDYPVTDSLHEACTEINIKLESPECNDLGDENRRSGDIVTEVTEAEDEPSSNINIESPKEFNSIFENPENGKHVRKQRKNYNTKNSKIQMKCEECKLTFLRFYVYCHHMMITHNMTFPKCIICDKYFHNARQLKQHMCRHLRAKNQSIIKDFLCDICGKHFSKYSSFRSHKITHNNNTGQFKCETCGKMFLEKFRLLLHRKCHSSCKEYMCEMCGMQFKFRSSFYKHRGKHLGIDSKKKQCPICDKRFENSSHVSLHLLTHNGAKPHICELCNRSFSLLTNLKRHLRRHTGEKPYFCDVCKRRFTRKTGLKKHRCNLKKPLGCNHKCNECGKLFKFNGTLQRHLRNAHTDGELKENLVTCKICGRTLAQSSNMKRHLMVHTNERRFACEMCKKRFRTKYEIMIHTRRHTGEKPYKCQFCEMSFVDSGEKGRHERKHSLNSGSTRKKGQQVNVL